MALPSNSCASQPSRVSSAKSKYFSRLIQRANSYVRSRTEEQIAAAGLVSLCLSFSVLFLFLLPTSIQVALLCFGIGAVLLIYAARITLARRGLLYYLPHSMRRFLLQTSPLEWLRSSWLDDFPASDLFSLAFLHLSPDEIQRILARLRPSVRQALCRPGFIHLTPAFIRNILLPQAPPPRLSASFTSQSLTSQPADSQSSTSLSTLSSHQHAQLSDPEEKIGGDLPEILSLSPVHSGHHDHRASALWSDLHDSFEAGVSGILATAEGGLSDSPGRTGTATTVSGQALSVLSALHLGPSALSGHGQHVELPGAPPPGHHRSLRDLFNDMLSARVQQWIRFRTHQLLHESGFARHVGNVSLCLVAAISLQLIVSRRARKWTRSTVYFLFYFANISVLTMCSLLYLYKRGRHQHQIALEHSSSPSSSSSHSATPSGSATAVAAEDDSSTSLLIYDGGRGLVSDISRAFSRIPRSYLLSSTAVAALAFIYLKRRR